MTPRQFLTEGRNIRQRIRAEEARMRQADRDAEEAAQLCQRAADAFRDMERDYAREAEALRDWTRAFYCMVGQIEDRRYSDVLKYVWLDGFSLLKAARKMNYSYEHTRRLHGQALNLFRQIYAAWYKETP